MCKIVANHELEMLAEQLKYLLLSTWLDTCIQFSLVWKQLAVTLIR